MKNRFEKNKKELKRKMATVFGDRMQVLSKEYREILLDDLVTAFENRMKILNTPKIETQFLVRIEDTTKSKAIQI
jgi:hypothetical protein